MLDRPIQTVDAKPFAPGRLWSLWDIIMKEHSAQRLVGALKLVMRQLASISRGADNDEIEVERVKNTLGHLRNVCELTALPVSVEAITNELLGYGENPTLLKRLVRESLETVHTTVENELATIVFLRVNAEYTRLHKEPAPFGQATADAFPLAIRDIEHGAKALAYGLGTSCVFHMMRVMELGLKVLAKKLGIPYAPSWESYISQIEKKITAQHKTKGIKWKRDEPFFREVLGDLQAVKIAWRNPTMHIVRHYDQDEGEDVFRAVKRFMGRLVEKGLSQV